MRRISCLQLSRSAMVNLGTKAKQKCRPMTNVSCICRIAILRILIVDQTLPLDLLAALDLEVVTSRLRVTVFSVPFVPSFPHCIYFFIYFARRSFGRFAMNN